LLEQPGRDVARVHGNSYAPTIGVPKLFVRSPLSYLYEPADPETSNYFSGLEDRDRAHDGLTLRNSYLPATNRTNARLGDLNRLSTDELSIQLRFSIFQKHLHDFYKILAQLLGSFRVRMRALKSRDVPDVRTGRKVSLENRLECPHQSLRFDLGEIYTRRTGRHFAAMK
jgi:hypothetical protein